MFDEITEDKFSGHKYDETVKKNIVQSVIYVFD